MPAATDGFGQLFARSGEMNGGIHVNPPKCMS
jgi:hypothetical protein